MRTQRTEQKHFAVCLDNTGYEASLEVAKLYRVVPDDDAESHGYVRVVDESGEDYAFALSRFHPVSLPGVIEEKLLAATHA